MAAASSRREGHREVHQEVHGGNGAAVGCCVVAVLMRAVLSVSSEGQLGRVGWRCGPPPGPECHVDRPGVVEVETGELQSSTQSIPGRWSDVDDDGNEPGSWSCSSRLANQRWPKWFECSKAPLRILASNSMRHAQTQQSSPLSNCQQPSNLEVKTQCDVNPIRAFLRRYR